MSERVERPDPHTAVMRELLVRYLDAWTPAVLRSHRRATYIEAGSGRFAADALRVFVEFADRLAEHHLDVVILRAPTDQLTSVLRELGEPAGLTLRSVDDPASLTVTGPVLAHLNVATAGPLDEPEAWLLIGDLVPGRAREVLLTMPPATAEQVTGYRARLRQAGLDHAVGVELTDDGGTTQLLLFATGDNK